MGTNLSALAAELSENRRAHCLPVRARETARLVAERTLALLFPHFSVDLPCESTEIEAELNDLRAAMCSLLETLSCDYAIPSPAIVDDYLGQLPRLHQELMLDARAIADGDPAAVNVDEVILGYPGFYAVAIHRIANVLHRLGFPLLPRLVAEFAHQNTGIDIHPGATIGRGFFVDHGTGLVIGETAQLGNGVKLFQGVTLGALLVEKQFQTTKRHPTLEDNVVVYANATILGGETVIGHDTIIAGNAWVTHSVPPFSIVGRDSEVRPRKSSKEADLEFYI